MNHSSHTDIWHRLHAMCAHLNPEEPDGGLLPGATEEQLAQAEQLLGLAFPETLKEAYRRFNGMAAHSSLILFPEQHRWMPLATSTPPNEMLLTWQTGVDVANGREADRDRAEDQNEEDEWVAAHGGLVFFRYGDKTRIPVACDFSVTGLFIDTAPPPSGQAGQLVYSDPVAPDTTFVLEASLPQAIEVLLSAYELKKIRYERRGDSNWVWADTGEIVTLQSLYDPEELKGAQPLASVFANS